MEFLGYQSWLILAVLTLASFLAVRVGSRGAVKHKSRRRQELEVLYQPTDDRGLSPSAQRRDLVVECVFTSQSFADIAMY
jgi:hypothetical protein